MRTKNDKAGGTRDRASGDREAKVSNARHPVQRSGKRGAKPKKVAATPRVEWFIYHYAGGTWYLGCVGARTLKEAKRCALNRWPHWRDEMYAIKAGEKDQQTAANSF